MNDKELTEFIHNSIIMSMTRGLSLTFDNITLKTLAAYGTSDSDFSKELKSKLSPHGHEDLYRVQLLQLGYIKVTNNTSPLTYDLTKRGVKVQQVGGIATFLNKQKNKEKIKFLKYLSLYIITPLIALISTGGLIYSIVKTDNLIEFKQPIKLNIENLPKFHMVDSISNNNRDTSLNTNSNKDNKVSPVIKSN